MIVSVDFETRSPVDLKTAGAFVYFDDPDAKVLMAAYRIDDGPLKCWTYDQPPPLDLWAAIEAGATIRAFNAQFETLGFDMLARRNGWPRPAYSQYVDTAAAAAAMALPRSLGDLGAALGLDVQKDKEGMRLIRKFSIPRRPRGEEMPGLYWNEPEDHPEDFQKFVEYCKRDVETEEAAAKRIVPLSDAEQQVWLLDQTINRRGIRIDVTSAAAAIALADKSKTMLDREMRLATAGYVPACSQPGKLVEWVEAQGVPMTSAAKAEVTDLLDTTDLPPTVRKALEIRQEAAKTSVAKLQAMLNRASDDGRVRGTFMYAGAATGRWANTGVNFANMPRPRKVFETAKENGALRPDALFSAIRTGEPAVLREFYGDDLGRPLHLVSDAIRGFIWAAPGHDLVQADYSGIEGAVIAWLSGEDWKVKALFEIMADPSLPDMYRRTAAAIMNLSTDIITKKHPLRQSVGKVSELACFAANTRILTSNGVKAIVDVTLDDLVWDGEEWVKHSGVVQRGARPVVDVDGIAVTPDHLLLIGQKWVTARKLASCGSSLSLALATGSGNLPWSVLTKARVAASTELWSGAPAARDRTRWRPLTCATGQPPGAAGAQIKRPKRHGKATLGTMTSSLMRIIGDAFSTVSLLAFSGAQTQTTGATRTTVGAAFPCSGGLTAGLTYPTSSRLTDGISQILSWIGLTSTATTHREISGSCREKSTRGTGARPETCPPKFSPSKQSSPSYVETYDIHLAGPRSRFTIFSDSGALIAHNCGFAGGVSAFYSMSKNYNVDLNALYPHVWGAADEARRERAVKRYENCLTRKDSKTDLLSREAWIACEIIKNGWRAANPAIAASWSALEDAARQAIQEPGAIFTAAKVRYLLKKGFLWAQLPSGRCLSYGAPKLKDQVWARRLIEGNWAEAEVMEREAAEALERRGLVKIDGATKQKVTALGVNSVTKKWERFALYGGLLAENNTQATARDLLVNGMLKAEASGYPIIAHVYDEILCEVPAGYGDVAEFERLICELPEWAVGLPLQASGWRGKRYRKD